MSSHRRPFTFYRRSDTKKLSSRVLELSYRLPKGSCLLNDINCLNLRVEGKVSGNNLLRKFQWVYCRVGRSRKIRRRQKKFDNSFDCDESCRQGFEDFRIQNSSSEKFEDRKFSSPRISSFLRIDYDAFNRPWQPWLTENHVELSVKFVW